MIEHEEAAVGSLIKPKSSDPASAQDARECRPSKGTPTIGKNAIRELFEIMVIQPDPSSNISLGFLP